MPAEMSREAVAKMLRAAWIADEPIPSAGTWDALGPIMRKAWGATADAVLALVEAKVRETIGYCRKNVNLLLAPRPQFDNEVVNRVMGRSPA